MQIQSPKLVILDRDGVINHDSDAFIKTPDELHLIESSLDAIASLNQMGILVAVASNQSGIERGILSQDHLNQIHQKLHRALAHKNAWIDHLIFCNSQDRNHPDYKPNPGMLLKIINYFGVSPQDCPIPFVGDKESDLIAAYNANCQPILVKTGKGMATFKTLQNKPTTQFGMLAIYENLSDYVHSLQIKIG